MPESALLALEIVAGTAGMGWFALAKLPHWQRVTGERSLPDPTRRNLRIAGALALCAALALSLVADHVTMSFLTWFMTLAAASLCVAFTLAWRPRALAPLAVPFVRARRRLQNDQVNDAE
jgi:hypothetical protein